jgi:ABC-2 type transport system ATP-binding protein
MALACALPFRPALLVMDEPFSGLDPLARDELIDGLKLRSGATTVLMSSHELAEVDDLTTDVAFLDRGKLLFQEPKRDLLARVKRVLVTLDRPLTRIPQLPAEWLDARIDGPVLTFVDTRFHAQDSPARIRTLLEGVSEIETQPIELRAIYTTMARAVRDPGSDS